MLRLLAVLCACVLLLAVACGDDSGYGGANATSTPAATAVATGPSGTPPFSGLLDDVINLAVQLNAMTHDEAVCVFELHPSIFNAFLQSSGLNQSSAIIETTLQQELEDLKREYAVQLDSCFTPPSG